MNPGSQIDRLRLTQRRTVASARLCANPLPTGSNELCRHAEMTFCADERAQIEMLVVSTGVNS
jgi:hypothetical protein